MSDRKRKQMAALVRLREHKEKVARANLRDEMQDLKNLNAQAVAKNELVNKLTEDLYTGLEDRLLTNHKVKDPGARFTTFAMSVNAARENLLLEEGLAKNLQDDLKTMRGGIVILRDYLKTAYQELEKAQHISGELNTQRRRHLDRIEEETIEEISNSRFVVAKGGL